MRLQTSLYSPKDDHDIFIAARSAARRSSTGAPPPAAVPTLFLMQTSMMTVERQHGASNLMSISSSHPTFSCLCYAFLFPRPRGECGYQVEVSYKKKLSENTCYYEYCFQYRKNKPNPEKMRCAEQA